MAANISGGSARKFLTRVLAAGALLAVYSMGTLAVTGAFMTTGISSANAWVRGRGYRGGYRGYRGGRGRVWVCRHNPYNSFRRCFWSY
jgi:hypothetical protein